MWTCKSWLHMRINDINSGTAISYLANVYLSNGYNPLDNMTVFVCSPEMVY